MNKLHHRRFKVAFKNTTKNAAILAEIVDATGELQSTEEVNQLIRVTRKGAISAGDHLVFRSKHYAASKYSDEVLGCIYRLIPLPDEVSWQVQNVVIEDPLTGLPKPLGGVQPPAQLLYCRKMTEKYEKDVHANMKPKTCYLTTEVIAVGDLLAGMPVKRVYVEQGIRKVET